MQLYPDDLQYLDMVRKTPAKFIEMAQNSANTGKYFSVDVVELAGLRLQIINSGDHCTTGEDEDDQSHPHPTVSPASSSTTTTLPPAPPPTIANSAATARDSSTSIDSMSRAWANRLSERVSPLQGKLFQPGGAFCWQ